MPSNSESRNSMNESNTEKEMNETNTEEEINKWKCEIMQLQLTYSKVYYN